MSPGSRPRRMPRELAALAAWLDLPLPPNYVDRQGVTRPGCVQFLGGFAAMCRNVTIAGQCPPFSTRWAAYYDDAEPVAIRYRGAPVLFAQEKAA